MDDNDYVHDGEAWVWNGARRHEAGATYVPVGALSGWWALPLDPSAVVSWACDDEDGFEVFGPVFGAQWADRATSAARAPTGGDDVDLGLEPPQVGEAHARLVAVRSLTHWYPEPIDELALRIDEALAWEAAGDTGRATAALTVAASTLASVAEVMWGEGASDGATCPLPAYCEDVVERAAALAQRLIPDDEDVAFVREVMARRVARPRGPARAPAHETARPRSAELARQTPLAGDPGGGGLEVLPVSPATVTSRILAWRGPRDPGLRAERHGDRVTVRVELAPDVDPDDREARDLAGFACEAGTGRIVGRAMLRDAGDGRHLTGTFAVPPDGDVAVGVVEVARLDGLRTDPLGRRLAMLDRLTVARWAALRQLIVADALGDDVVEAVTLGAAAEAALAESEREIEALRGRVRGDGPAALGPEDARLVEERVTAALRPYPPGASVVAPTLAEGLIALPSPYAGHTAAGSEEADDEGAEWRRHAPDLDDVDVVVAGWVFDLQLDAIAVRRAPEEPSTHREPNAPDTKVRFVLESAEFFEALMSRPRTEYDNWPTLHVTIAGGNATVSVIVPAGPVRPVRRALVSIPTSAGVLEVQVEAVDEFDLQGSADVAVGVTAVPGPVEVRDVRHVD